MTLKIEFRLFVGKCKKNFDSFSNLTSIIFQFLSFVYSSRYLHTINQSDERLSPEWTTDQSESLRLTALNRLCVPSSSVMRKSWSCCARSVWATTLHTRSAQVVVAVIEKASYAAFTYNPFVSPHACKVLVMFVWACV